MFIIVSYINSFIGYMPPVQDSMWCIFSLMIISRSIFNSLSILVFNLSHEACIIHVNCINLGEGWTLSPKNLWKRCIYWRGSGCVFLHLYTITSLHKNSQCLRYTTQVPSSKCVVTCKVLNLWKVSLINVVPKLTSRRDNDDAII